MAGSESWRNPRPAPQVEEIRSKIGRRWTVPPWLRAWWPALLWAALISFASTDTFSGENTGGVLARIWHWFDPTVSKQTIEIANHYIRKTAHFTEYFIFFVLLYRSIRGSKRGWSWSWAFPAWAIAAAYSVLDEVHQSFVVSRTASPWDSLLDSVGAFGAMLFLYLYFQLKRSKAPSG